MTSLDYVETFDTHDELPSPSIGDIEFSLYGDNMQPPVAVDTEARYVEKQPIGEDPVRQYLGAGLDQVTIVGECSPPEAWAVDNLVNNEEVYVRTYRWSGYATVDATSTDSMGKRYNGTWVHKYTVELTEI